MNRLFIIILLGLIASSVVSCSDEKEEMDPWETEMAKKLQAENIQLSHLSTSKTINGVSAGGESYLQLSVLDSKVLEHSIGFWVRNQSDGDFANLKITIQ